VSLTVCRKAVRRCAGYEIGTHTRDPSGAPCKENRARFIRVPRASAPPFYYMLNVDLEIRDGGCGPAAAHCLAARPMLGIVAPLPHCPTYRPFPLSLSPSPLSSRARACLLSFRSSLTPPTPTRHGVHPRVHPRYATPNESVPSPPFSFSLPSAPPQKCWP